MAAAARDLHAKVVCQYSSAGHGPVLGCCCTTVFVSNLLCPGNWRTASAEPCLVPKRLECREEEVSFSRTLNKGLDRFRKAAASASNGKLPSADAFALWDSFGFPLAPLTQARLRCSH